MGRGFDLVAKGVQAYLSARAELGKIGEAYGQLTLAGQQPSSGQTAPATGGTQSPQPSAKPQAGAGTRTTTGHLVPTFPSSVNVSNTLIRVYASGGTKTIQTGIGNQTISLPPGTYDVEISNVRLAGVTIRDGQDTPLKVGVLQVTTDNQTTYEVLEKPQGRKLASGFGNQTIGLPVGSYHVRMHGTVVPVTIEEGKITNLH